MSSENLKRGRTVHFDDPEQTELNTKTKVRSLNRTRTNDFTCPVYYQGKTFHFQLSNIFQYTSYAVLFFCQYDFSAQSKGDLSHIEENYSKFIQLGALPIVITHDQPHIHEVYATIGRTTGSLTFTPSFVLASDSVSRLISVSFKSIDMDTLDMIRSVVIIDSDLNIVYTHRVQPQRFFPMKSILNCFE
ncbi:hypothetical protein EDC94DRAFT_697180 [Helicostylum pulchrum]|uniref:Alkyl hydroperoxide reductase subunit C/ Thiol specific antioxidant domain-containing protein n=1 Tax=Helicostylum pulchrum TaxID=562976 RepID=A0ABP9Y3C1_9FUNG|nr:hypothetical protein EDC94DRAFT_697180 [Helicostylum pulchrum]